MHCILYFLSLSATLISIAAPALPWLDMVDNKCSIHNCRRGGGGGEGEGEG